MSERPEKERVDDTPVETRDRTVHGTTGDPDGVREAVEGFLPADRMKHYRDEWADVQTSFVDNPQTAVQEAHGLVSSLMTELNETLTSERGRLESAWNRGERADTEALRLALTRYRAFFNRLLR